MPLYEFECSCGRLGEHWFNVSERNTQVRCSCGKSMKRLPGGHKMLHFEEGRARTHYSLSDKPITSYAQQKRLMREHGVVEAGTAIPPRLMKSKKGPIKPEMKEYIARNKGRWY